MNYFIINEQEYYVAIYIQKSESGGWRDSSTALEEDQVRFLAFMLADL